MGFFVMAGLLGVAGISWVLYYVSETHRDTALEKFARRQGMSFRFGLPQDLKDVLPRFRVMEKAREAGGDFQAGINSISGTWRDRRIVFFDYQWITVHYWRSRRTWWQYTNDEDEGYRKTHSRSAVAVELGVALQPVIVRPERLVDKALALVGYEDIDFDLQPEFSDRFYVNSPDRVAARKLVTPAFARFCLDHVRCTVDIVGPWMLMHVDRPIAPSQLPDWFDVAGRLSELITREQAGSR